MAQFFLVAIFVIFKLLYLVHSSIIMDNSNVKCAMRESGNEINLHATWINKRNFTSITEGDKPASTDSMPSKPKDPLIVVLPSNNTALVSWYSPTYGKQFVKHFLLDLEEIKHHTLYRYYLLVNVSMSIKSTTKFTCYYDLSYDSYSLTSTIWAFGPIKLSESGHMLADVDSESKSETVTKKTDKDLIAKVATAKQCVRADVKVRVAEFPSVLTYSVESNQLPNGTNIKIQILKVGAKQQGDTIKAEDIFIYKGKHVGKYINHVPGYYYIRVHRLCKMYKDEAKVIRSSIIFIPSSKKSKSSQGVTSLMIQSKLLDSEPEVKSKILLLVFIIIGFGIVAILQLAMIIKLCEGLTNKRKIQTQFYKHPTLLTVDRTGSARTRVLRPKKVAILFTKDTKSHVSRVYQLKSSLLRLGIDALPYDETHVKDMRSNWIQVGENIATQSDVVVFIISPHLMKQCKPPVVSLNEISPKDVATDVDGGNTTGQGDEHNKDMAVETANTTEDIVLNSVLHNLPAVVINSLKVGNLSFGSFRPKVIHVHFTENKDNVKGIVNTMYKDHPSLIHEDIVINYTSEDNELNNNHIKKLAEKIKS